MRKLGHTMQAHSRELTRALSIQAPSGYRDTDRFTLQTHSPVHEYNFAWVDADLLRLFR